MDPTAAYEIMTDETADVDERVEAAENLRDWLDKGGFLPLRLPVNIDERRTRGRFYVDRRIAETLRLARSA